MDDDDDDDDDDANRNWCLIIGVSLQFVSQAQQR